MKPTTPDKKEKVYFYQEDPLGYVNAADPDIREGDQPVPWRRVYGFAQNSHLLDRGFAFGSLALIVIWLVFPSNLTYVQQSMTYFKESFLIWLVGFGSVALLYAAGETQRRDKSPRLPQLKPIQFPLLLIRGCPFCFVVCALSRRNNFKLESDLCRAFDNSGGYRNCSSCRVYSCKVVHSGKQKRDRVISPGGTGFVPRSNLGVL